MPSLWLFPPFDLSKFLKAVFLLLDLFLKFIFEELENFLRNHLIS